MKSQAHRWRVFGAAQTILAQRIVIVEATTLLQFMVPVLAESGMDFRMKSQAHGWRVFGAAQTILAQRIVIVEATTLLQFMVPVLAESGMDFRMKSQAPWMARFWSGADNTGTMNLRCGLRQNEATITDAS